MKPLASYKDVRSAAGVEESGEEEKTRRVIQISMQVYATHFFIV